MPDALDRLIVQFGRYDASGRAGVFGPDHEEEAFHLACAEFGTVRGEPPRPTVTATWDASEGAVVRSVAARTRAFVDGDITSGEAILRPVVADLAELQREAIGGDTPPPLAESTKAARRRRGNASTRTLVDTGKMQGAVDSETKPGGEGWP